MISGFNARCLGLSRVEMACFVSEVLATTSKVGKKCDIGVIYELPWKGVCAADVVVCEVRKSPSTAQHSFACIFWSEGPYACFILSKLVPCVPYRIEGEIRTIVLLQ